MGSSTPDAPEPTPEQVAMEKRTQLGLERERAKTERRLKAQARSKIGAKSLLAGIKPQTGLRQEDVEHSKAISSERLGFDKANIFKKLKIIEKEGAGRLGLKAGDVANSRLKRAVTSKLI